MAIEKNLPVNISFGYTEYEKIASELLSEKYSNSVVFVAWQSDNIPNIARNIMTKAGLDARDIPEWDPNDYDIVFS